MSDENKKCGGCFYYLPVNKDRGACLKHSKGLYWPRVEKGKEACGCWKED